MINKLNFNSLILKNQYKWTFLNKIIFNNIPAKHYRHQNNFWWNYCDRSLWTRSKIVVSYNSNKNVRKNVKFHLAPLPGNKTFSKHKKQIVGVSLSQDCVKRRLSCKQPSIDRKMLVIWASLPPLMGKY